MTLQQSFSMPLCPALPSVCNNLSPCLFVLYCPLFVTIFLHASQSSTALCLYQSSSMPLSPPLPSVCNNLFLCVSVPPLPSVCNNLSLCLSVPHCPLFVSVFLHASQSSTALFESANSSFVHSLMFSSHLFLGPPLFHLPLTLPRLPFNLKHTLARTAIKNGAVFEITYAGALGGDNDPSIGSIAASEGGSAAKRNWWAAAREIVRVTKGKGIIVSGGITNVADLRAPRDVGNL